MASRSKLLNERARLVARELLLDRRRRQEKVDVKAGARVANVQDEKHGFDEDARVIPEVERTEEVSQRRSSKKWPLKWSGHAGMAAQQHSATKAVRRAWLKTRRRRSSKRPPNAH
jgi:hypothetical protein